MSLPLLCLCLCFVFASALAFTPLAPRGTLPAWTKSINIGIRDMVSYEGTDVDTLEHNFRGAVDEYLAFCTAEGKTPDTPFKGSFNVRLPQELHKRAALYAEEHNRKLNSVVQEALLEFLSDAG